jgi:MFS family permease
MYRFCFFVVFWLQYVLVAAQDSLQVPVAVPQIVTDSLGQKTTDVISYDSAKQLVLSKLLHFNIHSKGEFVIQQPKVVSSKDWLFYYILGVLLLFGVLRLSYARYFKDLFRFFFRTSLRVNQIREQLAQSGLQSLLFNVFFAIAFGIYLFLLLRHYQKPVSINEWLMPLAGTAVILLLYLCKYLFLQISGWLFSMQTATETYTFIIFLINKVAGVVILPFIILIAFAAPSVAEVAVSLSLVLVAGLFLYRFLRSYQPVYTEIKLERLHFFIFFLAAEIVPLLLIYKVLVLYF